ncbi:MAG TPA: DMT family transporter [Chitinophaga sp.]|uniref:DMT family transporter n=1 Tax=Chitinophaga sp. TaxID=1869181 RepID=UPI002DBC4D4C|nr:DMT family transporter [Chitinophaga sp.]HEU4554203.1 DMT family transporter [Chitinophaga sp.]
MKKAFLQLHLSVFLAGFTGILGKLISLNEGLLTWYRLFITAVTLLVIFLWRGMLKKVPFRDVLIIGSNGAIIGLHWVFFYGSIKYANVSIGVVCFSLTSLFTALFDPLINRRRFDAAELLLSLLTLCGILLIFHFNTSYRTGIILGIISSGFAALFTVFNKRLVKRFDTYTLGFYEVMAGTLFITLLLPVYLSQTTPPVTSLLPSWQDAFYLLALSWACTIWLYALNLSSLKKISAFTVNLCFNLEPVYSILLAFLLFEENKYLGWTFYVGLLCIMLSVLLQMMRVLRQHRLEKQLSANPIRPE